MRDPARILNSTLLAAAVASAFALAGTFVPAAAAQDAEDEVLMERIGKGRVAYRVYCGSCHGKHAQGDGVVAAVLEVAPADLTRISLRREGEFPFEEIRQIIDGRQGVRGHGDRDMPIWGDAFKVATGAEDDAAVAEKITQLVYFLRSIQETDG